MDLAVSSINFNGGWERVGKDSVVKKQLSGGGYAKYVLKKRIYHPFQNETKAEIEQAVGAYPCGWSYGIWQLHPNARQRNRGSITELYAARVGEVISPDKEEDYTPHNLQLEIDNVDIDTDTFIKNHFNDHFRICDVAKLEKSDATKIISKYFGSEQE